MYEIVQFALPDDAVMRVLSPVGRRSFMDEMVADPKKRQRAALIARTAYRVERNGIGWAFESETFKWLSKDVSVCELRVKGNVIRVMTYLERGIAFPVYLFDFDGHQGKRASIPSALIAKAETLAKEAAKCLERERNGRHE